MSAQAELSSMAAALVSQLLHVVLCACAFSHGLCMCVGGRMGMRACAHV